MNGIVEKTAHAGAAQTDGLGLQVERLTDHPGFPEQFGVTPGFGTYDRFELGQHGQSEHAVAGDFLMTVEMHGGLSRLGLRQAIQR